MAIKVSRDEAALAAEDFLVGMAVFAQHIFNFAQAAQLVGFAPEEFEKISRFGDRRSIPYRLDPDRYELVRLYGSLADYAWEGIWFGNEVSLEEAMTEAETIGQILTSGSPHDPYGEPCIDEKSLATLGTVLNAANARRELDLPDGQLGLGQVAVLANVSDKTIRMAANPKLENHLKTENDGKGTIVHSDDARAWLERRPGFKATRLNAGLSGQPQIVDASILATTCNRYREQAGLSLKDLRAKLKWSAEEALAYQNMERGAFSADAPVFDSIRLLSLARTLAFPDPEQFTRDAIRVVYTARAIAEIQHQLEEIPHE